MRKPVVFSVLGIATVAAGVLAAWWVAFRRSDVAGKILAAYREDAQYGGLTISYPLDQTLFPPEIVAPTFRWEDTRSGSDTWLVTLKFEDDEGRLNGCVRGRQWTPSDEQWETIKRRSSGRIATVTVLGVNHAAAEEILSGARISIRTSRDEVGAPIFYREVNLPFVDAVKDPSHIRWRFGAISSKRQPPIVLENLPVCGNCHSFSADGGVIGMDVDYANSKASYAILPVREEMVLERSKIITWDDYKREEGELSFGLLSQVSPDGKYVVSTVKDRSVFVPKPGLAFSQLFFPIKGILAYYRRETRSFHALPGADDRRFVHSNPTWSPDGKYIVFARSKVHRLKGVRDEKTVLLTREECREFLEERKTFRFDLYRIPFRGGEGGEAEPLEGASANGMSNFFARHSPDGKWIVFCKARTFMLLQPDSELYIIPAGGGKARRLRCNTPRMNSWHSWSPNGRWLVFASKANTPYTQLFLTHVDEEGRSTPAVLLSQFTAADRAANIPEFVATRPDAIRRIRERFLDDYSFVRAGNEFLRYDDQANAVRAFRRALEFSPKNAVAHSKLGALLASQGSRDEAIGHLAKAIELNPDDQHAHRNLGIELVKQRKLLEAVAHFRAAVRIDPKFAEAHQSLAGVLQKIGMDDQAIEAYKQTLSLQPDNPHVHFQLGRLLLRQNRPTEAEAHFAAAIEIEPEVPDAHYYMGRLLNSKGEVQQAIRCFRRAIELNPKFVLALNGLAWIYATDTNAAVRNGEQAVALARRACEIAGERLPVLFGTLAAAYAETGQFDQAVETARKAIRLAEQVDGDKTGLAGQIRSHLDFYLAGKPFRQPPP